TNDTRESAAIYVCRDLLRERARLTIYDPQVSKEQIQSELSDLMSNDDGDLSEAAADLINNNITVVGSAEEAAQQAHAVAVLTEWDEFKDLDFESIYQSMMKPAFLFDGRNLLDQNRLSKLGFEVHSIGRA
ncbi:MAG: nucleotide sugar dehydrogenase, partial [Planctomycetaceae bacterium]|nr:nucleotide sugar dehydrogenase [Planctomycetaceae bacterium]